MVFLEALDEGLRPAEARELSSRLLAGTPTGLAYAGARDRSAPEPTAVLVK
jgi:hypothetical protein